MGEGVMLPRSSPTLHVPASVVHLDVVGSTLLFDDRAYRTLAARLGERLETLKLDFIEPVCAGLSLALQQLTGLRHLELRAWDKLRLADQAFSGLKRLAWLEIEQLDITDAHVRGLASAAPPISRLEIGLGICDQAIAGLVRTAGTTLRWLDLDAPLAPEVSKAICVHARGIRYLGSLSSMREDLEAVAGAVEACPDLRHVLLSAADLRDDDVDLTGLPVCRDLLDRIRALKPGIRLGYKPWYD